MRDASFALRFMFNYRSDNHMDFSLVAQAFDTLRIAPPPKLILLEAETLSSAHVLPYPPDMPVLFTNVSSAELALQLKKVLMTTYPAEHTVVWVESGKKKDERLSELSGDSFGENVCLYIPALSEGTSFEAFAEIIAHLRAPEDRR